jgi:hypothetical protein
MKPESIHKLLRARYIQAASPGNLLGTQIPISYLTQLLPPLKQPHHTESIHFGFSNILLTNKKQPHTLINYEP